MRAGEYKLNQYFILLPVPRNIFMYLSCKLVDLAKRSRQAQRAAMSCKLNILACNLYQFSQAGNFSLFGKHFSALFVRGRKHFG